MFEDLKKIGVGVVVRDAQGLFIAAYSYVEEIGNDAEVLDVARGLEFAATVCLFDVTVEGDSVNVIR